MNKERIDVLKASLEEELGKLVDFWTGTGNDIVCRGVFGKCVGNNHKIILRDEPKTAISQGRALWGLSAAYNATGNAKALEGAGRIFEFVRAYVIDETYGGAFSAVTREGMPQNSKKQPYGSSFIIYGLVEYYKATGDNEALDAAKGIYESFEAHAHDDEFGGYYTEFTRDWQLLGDGKTLTAQQHLMEAYAQLYTVWQDEKLKERIIELTKLCCDDRFFRLPDYYYYQRLDRDFTGRDELDPRCLFGDTAEMAWLIPESAKVIGDGELDALAKGISEAMTEQIVKNAVDSESGGIFESPDSKDKVWWVECEAVNNLLYAYSRTGDESFFELAEKAWQFCCDNLIKEDGMWYWGTDKDGTVLDRGDKPSPIPDAYHTCRTCVRGIEILKEI